MEFTEHIQALRREGRLLGAAAARADLGTPIPTCPEWTMRDLVRHVGDVHRWAAAHVADRRADPVRREELAAVAGPLPEDDRLLEWFAEGHASLLHTLETADPDMECWTFLPAPSSAAFWARRQAHETGIHRADAESPAGVISPFDASFAVDGIEEMLFGFLLRSNEAGGVDVPTSLSLQAEDTGDEWLVRLGPEGVEATRGHDGADCSVRGSASLVHLLLWNRVAPGDLDVSGDQSVLKLWRENVQIHWSRAR